MEKISSFLSAAEHDARLGANHISLYVALWKKWKDSGCGSIEPLSFFRNDIVALCKISGGNTYHKVLRQLHDYGYIKYVPSYNHFLGSLVFFIEVKKNSV